MTERQTNKRLLRDLIDVFWNQGALDRHAEFFVPGAVVHSGLIDYAVPDGLVGGYAQGLMAAFPDLHHTIDHQLIDGDRAAMRYHGTGTLQNDYRGLTASGQKLDAFLIDVFGKLCPSHPKHIGVFDLWMNTKAPHFHKLAIVRLQRRKLIVLRRITFFDF